jgi:hypothetical protein
LHELRDRVVVEFTQTVEKIESNSRPILPSTPPLAINSCNQPEKLLFNILLASCKSIRTDTFNPNLFKNLKYQ